MTARTKTLLVLALVCFAFALGNSFNENGTSWRLFILFLPGTAIPLFLLIRDFWKSNTR